MNFKCEQDQSYTDQSYSSPRHRNTALVSSGVSLTSRTSLAFVGHPSSDGIRIKILYGIDVLLRRPASHPHLFLLDSLKLNLTLLLDQLRLA